jgi:hypothetical protein
MQLIAHRSPAHYNRQEPIDLTMNLTRASVPNGHANLSMLLKKNLNQRLRFFYYLIS